MSWQMDELEARARRQLDILQDANERMAAIRVAETSPKGEVMAEVDGVGALLDLKFSSAITRMSSAELGTLVVTTAAIAAQRAMARRARIMEEFNEVFAEAVAAPDVVDITSDALNGRSDEINIGQRTQ